MFSHPPTKCLLKARNNNSNNKKPHVTLLCQRKTNRIEWTHILHPEKKRSQAWFLFQGKKRINHLIGRSMSMPSIDLYFFLVGKISAPIQHTRKLWSGRFIPDCLKPQSMFAVKPGLYPRLPSWGLALAVTFDQVHAGPDPNPDGLFWVLNLKEMILWIILQIFTEHCLGTKYCSKHKGTPVSRAELPQGAFLLVENGS